MKLQVIVFALGAYVFALADSGTMSIPGGTDRWEKVVSLEHWDSFTETLGKDGTMVAGFFYITRYCT